MKNYSPVSAPLPPFVSNDEGTTISIPYLGKGGINLKNELKKLIFRIVFKPVASIRDTSLKYKKMDRPPINLIYKFNCGTCNNAFVGQTSQYINMRLAQHEYAVKRKDTQASAAADHWANTGHSNFKFSEANILAWETNFYKRNVKEAYYINQEKNIINRDHEKGNWDHIYDIYALQNQ